MGLAMLCGDGSSYNLFMLLLWLVAQAQSAAFNILRVYWDGIHEHGHVCICFHWLRMSEQCACIAAGSQQHRGAVCLSACGQVRGNNEQRVRYADSQVSWQQQVLQLSGIDLVTLNSLAVQGLRFGARPGAITLDMQQTWIISNISWHQASGGHVPLYPDSACACVT